jgi:hypothetical protein
MISFISYAPLALVAVSAVSGALVPPNRLMKHALIARKVKPATYAEGYLENYNDYHIRYLALGCEDQHGKEFFDQCCHPMLATEKLETARPKQCHPSAAALSSAALAEPTSTVKTPDDGDDDCDEEDPKPKATGGPKHSHKGDGHKDTPKLKEAPKQDPPKQDPPKQDPPKNNGPSAAISSGGGSHTGGHGTFYLQNGIAGACRTLHTDRDFIAALDYRMYGDLGVKSPHCGKKMSIKNTNNGHTVNVIVADACPTCDHPNSVDLSKAAFMALADLEDGLIPIEWKFI